jgi:hypothetical protein
MIRFGVSTGHDIVATSASSSLKVDFLSLLMGSSSLGFSRIVHHTRKGACHEWRFSVTAFSVHYVDDFFEQGF